MRFLYKHELLKTPGNLNILIMQFQYNYFSVPVFQMFGMLHLMVLRSQVSCEAEQGSQLYRR